MHQLANAQARLLLTEARKLIDTVGWNQDYFAKTADGEILDDVAEVTVEKACSFCTLGAGLAAAHQLGWISENRTETDGIMIQDALAERLNLPGVRNSSTQVANWNDQPERTKDDVLALYDAAIERIEP